MSMQGLYVAVSPCLSLLVPFQWPMEGGHSFLQCYSLVKPIPPLPPLLNLIFLTAPFSVRSSLSVSPASERQSVTGHSEAKEHDV